MRRLLCCTAALALSATSPFAYAQRVMENLDRGVVAVNEGSGKVFVGWRLLGTEAADTAFNVYRQSASGAPVKINAAPLTGPTSLVDNNALTENSTYFVRPLLNGQEQKEDGKFTLAADAPVRNYLEVPLKLPEGAQAGDGSVADLDGDGQYEIIVKCVQRGIDSASAGVSGIGSLQAYKLDGTLLWTVSLGKNIREGEHDTPFIVADFDGDGRAELAIRTSDGAVDGTGAVIGDPNADWRDMNQQSRSYGKNLTNHEYMTIFDGLTGKLLAKEQYVPSPIPLDGWGGIGGNSGNDNNGTRSMRMLAGVAYLDGQLPSAIMCRGVYGRSVLAAWDYRGGKLSLRWVFDTNEHPRKGQPYIPASTTVSAAVGLNKVTDNTGKNWDGARPGEAMVWDRDGVSEYAMITAVDGPVITVNRQLTAGENKASHTYGYTGMGGHAVSSADVDGDGKDEIIYKAMVVDDNGQGLFTTGLRHGDALHVGDLDVTRPGLEVFGVQENETERQSTWPKWTPAAAMFDAKTGELLWGIAMGQDAGRGLTGDIDPRHPGSESWGIPGGMYSAKGVNISPRGPNMTNFAIWWDGDPLREMINGNQIGKWDWEAGQQRTVFTAQGAQAAAGTKSSPVIQGDILGDWREEFVLREGTRALRIYTSTAPTEIRLHTLMHDSQYRLAVAWQNTSYNQPPHPSFAIGHDMAKPAQPKLKLAPRVLRTSP